MSQSSYDPSFSILRQAYEQARPEIATADDRSGAAGLQISRLDNLKSPLVYGFPSVQLDTDLQNPPFRRLQHSNDLQARKAGSQPS